MHITKAIELPGITAPKTLRHCFATILQDANVDPLIRNEVMGHSPASTYGGAHSLGMTGVYTHSQPETTCRQLRFAFDLDLAFSAERTGCYDLIKTAWQTHANSIRKCITIS